MTIEEQFIGKTYYKMFINEHEGIHPIHVIGDAYQEELQKDIPDLSPIRFAQGEVYFHHKDYEAAIFKWENVTNELSPWAKKNIADAYYESGILPNAEDLYLAIDTDNLTLQTEVALKLFSLYIARGKVDSAVKIIKKTIVSNPDYPNVTERARAFFEEQNDWENAIELAVNEAKRTGSLNWFQILHLYVDQGVTKNHAPNYFSQALIELFSVDQLEFEGLASSLWRSYEYEGSFFAWLKEINYILLNFEMNHEEAWPELSRLHKETYDQFIDGRYLIKQVEEFIPDLLTNWLRLSDSVVAGAAVLSWNELFPVSISVAIVEEADKLIAQTEHSFDELEECLTLFEAIMKWAVAHDMGEHNRLIWIVDQLIDFDSHHLFVTGYSGSGKSSFINMIIGEELQDSPTTSMVMFSDSEELQISEISDQGITDLSGFAEFQARMDRRRNALESMIEFRQPTPFLYENQLAILDTPGFNGSHYDRKDIFNYLHVADTILFVLDANDPFSDKEQEIVSQMQTLAPDIPIHFLLNKMDTIANEQDAAYIVKETKREIASILPNAKVFAFSSKKNNGQSLADLKGFVSSIKQMRNIEDKRLSKLLYFIRTTITSLLQKRIDVENQLIESVRWNEDLLMRLNGAINQLKDIESEKTSSITKAYRSIKDSLQKEISDVIPNMLKECSKLISEKSDFSKIHIELNDEMNKRIQDHLNNDVLPKYFTALQGWIQQAKGEFDDSQAFLVEMSEGLNNMYGAERISPDCDYKVLDDWSRDTDRMTTSIPFDPVNIMMRRTPSQFLLKSAGRLLGALSQNKTMLFHKYQAFVENEDYSEAVSEVNKRFFQQFELFERALDRDTTLFFRQPLKVLNQAADEARIEISNNKEMLSKMNTNPELFRDPLTLFEVRLRQFEWMTVAGKGMQTVY
ncbi:GTPase domain-containing protein [Neobacillus massiliamazoniensis]|uniref:p-loop containing nucleoside triphosphate hydrolase n=1 Tax=Neobacillus massiliamazoniensis TaxID=1499688 RepID=A0A0U1NVB7_9BACI|nr:GTPase domain-containing protein [Neobacillus massiliamazoniensis]CRK81981.1 P-loop containing nucleoside triphosphate hydrolase [Neobacillus massiliamazoniensis]